MADFSVSSLQGGDGFALGRQMTVEFYDCDPKVLADAAAMEKIFLEAAGKSGATVIESRFHQFLPQGVSGVVVISESHFAVHAWPEHEYAAVDFFTCGDGVDFDVATKAVASGIGSRQCVISSLISRGIVGNNGVERLVPVVENRECRTFQLSWKKRYEQSDAKAISIAIDICECSSQMFDSPEQFIREFTEISGLKCRGDFQLSVENGDWCDFVQTLTTGRVSGSICRSERTFYLDIFIKGFFDPREAAERAVLLLQGKYYRMQPQVRV